MLQDHKGVVEAGTANKYKMITYDHDLVSGKVNMVSYNPHKEGSVANFDEFYHRYNYDAENRLLNVETSRDKLLWERDAAYSYYKHGPLSRMELGQLQVQGVDYAYTLQGWLKGVNSSALSSTMDIWKDGSTTSVVAGDVMGFALHYFDTLALQDYKSIGTYGTPVFAGVNNGSFRGLYNGNIAAISMNNGGLKKGDAAATNAIPLFYNYSYDQLNRLVGMDVYKGFQSGTNTWVPVAVDDHKEAISYDANGNILKYLRQGSPMVGTMSKNMDSLNYIYYANTNQLRQVTDKVNYSANYAGDIDNQTNVSNYVYDDIGNLKTDEAEGITGAGIVWNVYGKILSIAKSSGTITYTYDAAGNRITKTANGKTTLYVRDASGNVMSVYEATTGSTNLTQTEVDLYGSSRLGIVSGLTVAPVTFAMASGFGTGIINTFTRGEKVFEMSNHLQNILATVSDKKIQVAQASPYQNKVSYYTADVVSAMDYSSFGQVLPGRSYNSNFRYTFNGKELDRETGYQDYGMRMYDIDGRFISVDPLTAKYPELTPYQFASNRPIDGIDRDGLEYLPYLPRFNTEGRSLNSYVAAFDNGAIDVLNTVPSLWNGLMATGYSIGNRTYGADLRKGTAQMVTGINKATNKIWNEPLKTLTSPDALEFLTSMYLGAKVPLPGGGSKGNLLKIETKITTVATTTDETVSYYRVQGGTPPKASKNLISIDANGNVAFKNATLNISTGNMDHALHFYNLRPGSQIIKFDVPNWFDDFLKQHTIPQEGASLSNQKGLAPKIVDITTPGTSYELPPMWSQWLNENVVPGSGKVIKKQ